MTNPPSAQELSDRLAEGADYPLPNAPAEKRIEQADARNLPFPDNSAHLVVTSPPYWQKRDYGVDGQIGQERTATRFALTLLDVLEEIERILHPSGSVFLNIGDTYRNKSLEGIPELFAQTVRNHDWTVRNDIIWVKKNGVPDPSDDRLAPRHEHIYHLVPPSSDGDYYYDLFGYCQQYTDGVGGAGDVWEIGFDRNDNGHLAPFPRELVHRALSLAAPPAVCTECDQPFTRVTGKTVELDTTRDQARRAMEIYEESDLTEDHIKAIWAVGLADAGKAQEIQTGTGKNIDQVEELAQEAKDVLGGYFREFTFPKRETVGWESACECETEESKPGVVLDPFVGTGTAVEVALENGLSGWGADLEPPEVDVEPAAGFQATLTPQNYD